MESSSAPSAFNQPHSDSDTSTSASLANSSSSTSSSSSASISSTVSSTSSTGRRRPGDRLINGLPVDSSYPIFNTFNDPNNYHVVRVRSLPPAIRDLSFCRQLAYGVGHFYNDLCASMWFTYLMLYLKKVLLLKGYHAGLLMFIGQLTDAISTPLVGLASDHSSLPRCIVRQFGRRKAWHLIGTICVTLSFPFIFNRCFPCQHLSAWEQTRWLDWWQVMWLTPFIMVFQFGWASVQISHLALIPELSQVDSSRTTMTSLRYGFAVIANLAVFLIVAYFLTMGSDGIVGPDDARHFQATALIVVGVGVCVAVVFHLAVREPVNVRRHSRMHSESQAHLLHMTWRHWFLQPQFYQVGLLYMFSRLFINISQVYFPFYIQYTQDFGKEYVAFFPMSAYLASFIVSTAVSVPHLNRLLNRKALYLFGVACGLCNCAWLYWPQLGAGQMFGSSALLGVAQAVILVTSLNITADLINMNTESGAFVYGALSFADKFANGVAYQIIELISPQCGTTDTITDVKEMRTVECERFYQKVMVLAPGGCLLCAAAMLLMLIPQKVGHRTLTNIRSDDTSVLLPDEA